MSSMVVKVVVPHGSALCVNVEPTLSTEPAQTTPEPPTGGKGDRATGKKGAITV